MAYRRVTARLDFRMINVQPIPLHLLIHKVEYHGYDKGSSYGEAYHAPVTIERVRLEPSNRLIKTSSNESVTSKGVLFIDALHTTPLIEFTEKSKVVMNGREFFVYVVEPIYATDATPHHWEVTLG